MDETQNGIIYSGKKSEVIVPDSIVANTAQNNPRQVLGRIPGANYSETQGSGFPSNGIGFRGLNPSQSIETNVRQNGYNTAADIFGYAESYYTTPMEAVERVEVTRGAASLQFGPQFGGVINFITRDGGKDKKFAITEDMTAGSYGFLNSYTGIGGQVGKLNYFGFAQLQQSAGWRPNSDYKQVSAYGKMSYAVNSKLTLGLEYTLFRNTIHMPGGFDDAQFKQNPDTSYRSRNWLNSPWNILAFKAKYEWNDDTKLFFTLSGMSSARALVWRNEDGGPGELDTIDRATGTYVNREVESEKMKHIAGELRLMKKYSLGGIRSTLSVGTRYFYGQFKRQGGGTGTTGTDFDLNLAVPGYEYDIDFSTTNVALFAEQIFKLNEKWSVTPGFRMEYIRNTAKGFTTEDTELVVFDGTKNRWIPLLGIGSQYEVYKKVNLYANISQAYSPVTYDQLTPFAVTSKIDPNMKDSKGYNADLGIRGVFKNCFQFDVSAFYMAYDNRIGVVEKTDAQGNVYTLRTNIANSAHKGLESYLEFFPVRCFKGMPKWANISLYNSFSMIDARFVSGDFNGKMVPYAPKTIERLGVNYNYKNFGVAYNISFTDLSYGDASNIVASSDPVAGIIPSYTVMDVAVQYTLKSKWRLKAGINNLTDERYFTKRTDEYPGPGIIPGQARSFYVGIGYSSNR